MKVYITGNEEETEALGYYIACRYHKDFNVFILVGDLGTGKTVFVKGFAKFFGIEDVRSPTFMLINRYVGRKTVFHADLYRISGWEDVYSSGITDIMDRELLIVEWGDRIESFLSSSGVKIVFKRKGEYTREISVSIFHPKPS